MELQVVGSDRPALVNDCWADLAQYRWRLDRDGYVCRKSHGKRVYLHHVVLPGRRYPDFVRDHVNRNKLDNRGENLRWLTLSESVQNRDASPRNVTGYRGVRFDARAGRYLARVQSGGRAVVRRWFDTPAEADEFLRSIRSSVLPLAA